tara:strand:- start:12404 stop:13375 length:972 start_codon:yes stop_codon:yes gene_type:complete
MLIKTLKTNRPSAYIAFFVTAVVFFVLDLIIVREPSLGSDHPLFSSLASFFLQHPIWSSVLLLAISLLMAMGWNNALSERGVFKNVTILPAFFFVILSSVFSFSSSWICLFIMLFVLNKLMLCFQQDRPYGLLFDSGFLIGLATLINPICILFFVLPYLSTAIYTTISWRNLLIPVIGLFSPFLFAWAYGFYFDGLPALSNYYFSFLKWTFPSFEYSLALALWSLLLLLLFFFAIRELIQWLSMKSLRSRKAFFLLFGYSICAFIGIFFVQDSWNHLLFFALPFSVLISNYFIFIHKRWWYESVFILILISTVYLQLAPLFKA